MMKIFSVPVITVTTAGTRVQVTNANNYRIAQTVLFCADPGNTGVIYVGDSSVDGTNGYALAAGASVAFNGALRSGGTEDFDIQDFYVDASVNSQKVRVTLLGRKP